MSQEWIKLRDRVAIVIAQAEGMEIHFSPDERTWYLWSGTDWKKHWQFRARPRKPATKKIKMLCWFINGHLNWLQEGNHAAGPDWKRIPSEDKEIEIEVEDD